MTPEQDFEEFWKGLVWEGNEPTPDQVKLELFDYHTMMHEVGRVYMEITGGRISKPNTASCCVIAEAEDLTQVAIREAVEEALVEERAALTEVQRLLGAVLFQVGGEFIVTESTGVEMPRNFELVSRQEMRGLRLGLRYS
jgi:hypothetical protein